MRVEQLTGQPTTAVDFRHTLSAHDRRMAQVVEAHCYLKIWQALWKVSAAMQP
jgi:hypothetical protein